jgi:hypothetical protein
MILLPLADRCVDYRALTERFQDFLIVEAHATSSLHERDTAEVYPVVQCPFRNAEPTREFIDVDERSRDGRLQGRRIRAKWP